LKERFGFDFASSRSPRAGAVCFCILESVQYHAFGETYFLIDQKTLDIGSLITRQLNNFSGFFIFLNRTIARKVLFECFANSFNVQIVSKALNGGDTFSSVSLLNANVHLVLGRRASLIASVLKGV
jgi:hypothetical protein